jgi:hypothetical protein
MKDVHALKPEVVSLDLARRVAELKRRAEIDKQILARAAHLLDHRDEVLGDPECPGVRPK